MSMSIVETGGTEILELRWRLFQFNRLAGVVFCWLLGPLMFAAGMGWLRGEAKGPWILLSLGGLLTVGGFAMLILRHQVKIDRSEGVVANRWSIMLPIKCEEHDFAEFDCVAVEREERGNERHSMILYPILLRGRNAELVVDDTIMFPVHALRLAEKVAKFMGCGLRDISSGEEVRIPAAEVGKPLRDRVRDGSQGATMPRQPFELAATYSKEDGNVVIRVPRQGLAAAPAGLMVAGLFIASLGLYFAWNRFGFVNRYFAGAVGGIGALVGIAMLLSGGTRAFTERLRVVVSGELLRVEKRSLLLRRVTQFAAGDLIQVGLIDPTTRRSLNKPYLFAWGEKTSVGFGAGLPVWELRWIRAVIAKAIGA